MKSVQDPLPIVRGRPDLVTRHPEKVDPENWDFHGEDTQYLLHSLHPYPARFIPQIPRRAIERWSSPGTLILDPFCGSGTTILEAALAGRNSIGVDNNGIATLIARAKVADYSDNDLRALALLAHKVDGVSRGNHTLTDTEAPEPPPTYPSLTKWFSRAAVDDLSWLQGQIEGLPDPSRLLALAVFSSIIVKASRQDSDTRYSATTRHYSAKSALSWWANRMKATIDRAEEVRHLRLPSSHKIVTADSRDLSFVAPSSVSLIVTSPPYLNAYDYHKYHRHRLEWLGADVALARDFEIGKHDTFTRPKATPEPYFDDLRKCMESWYRVLEPRGYAFIAVGDGIVSHRFVPVGDRLIELGVEVGFTFKRRWIRALDSTRKSFNQSSRIRREHLILLGKESQSR